MQTEIAMPVPTHAELLAAVGQEFRIGTAGGHTVAAVLAAAPAGIAMDDQHTCFHAVFVLPAGIRLPQEVYRITSPAGISWDLLATPTRPEPDGRATLSIVLHYRLKDIAVATNPDAAL